MNRALQCSAVANSDPFCSGDRLTPETRNLQQRNPETSRITIKQTRFQMHGQIRDRAYSAATRTEDLVWRLQLLKQRLSGWKSKSTRVLSHVYKVPPDPGPATDGEPISNARIYAVHERKEETSPRMLYEEQFQTFTGSNVRNQGISFEAQNEVIKGEEMGEENPSSTAYQTKYHHKLQARCSTHCLMAE